MTFSGLLINPGPFFTTTTTTTLFKFGNITKDTLGLVFLFPQEELEKL